MLSQVNKLCTGKNLFTHDITQNFDVYISDFIYRKVGLLETQG